MNDTRTIKENIARITAGIDAERYPILFHYLENKRSRLKKDLLSMLEHMAANRATTIYGGLRYWTSPKDDMMKQKSM